MEELPSIEFEVGEKYTNEKGLFEVLSIKGDKMTIHFENGQELTSDIALQRRIQERRQWEKILSEKKEQSSAGKAHASSRKAEPFAGLQSEDFRNKLSGTKWRSRAQLGGSVTRQLASSRFKLNSWSAKRRNEIHWADETHWKKKTVPHCAKFFAHADETSFAWGFYVERPDATGADSIDWDTFIAWLRDAKNDAWLRTVALEQGLEIYDAHNACFGGVIRAREDDWEIDGSSVRNSSATLGECIDSWRATAWLDLMIAKRIPKAAAMEKKEAIAGDVAVLFDRLMPLYEAAVSHMK